MNTVFIEWLTAQMAERNMTNAELSRLSGLSPSHVSRLFSGDRGAGVGTMQKLARALKLPPEIVYKAGGIGLSSQTIKSAKAERLASLIDTLSEEDQLLVDSLIETLKRRGAEKKNGNRGKQPQKAEGLS